MIEKNYIAEIIDGKCSDAKSKIIKAGLEEFAINSLAAARTRQIAAKAGVNHAAINYYFGGKQELYFEIARQVADFIEDFTRPFFARAEKIYKSKSAKDAKELIKDYLMSRVCVESSKSSELLRCIILIVTREEVYQTEVFDIFFNRAFKPSGIMLQKIVEIASHSKITGQNAMIVGQMLIGQVHMFNSARAGFKRMHNWNTLGENEVKKIAENIFAALDKIFD